MEQALAAIVEQVRGAAAAASPLRIRGGGSKDFLGPARTDPVLDTRPLAGLVAYEPSELVVTVGAGTSLRQLEDTLAAQGQFLPFEPPHFSPHATVGGMVACGLAGPARAAVGGVRDYVLGIQMINGRGERLRFGGQVMKNVAGYDVSRLMAGSMGVLGVLTELSLKVLPQPVAEASLRLACTQAQALERLVSWAGQPLPLNASAWQPGAPGQLTVRLRGARAAVDAALERLGGERLEPTAAAGFWQGLREQKDPGFAAREGQCLWRLSVPDTAPVLALPPEAELVLAEWGGALRWAWAPPSAGDALRAAVSAVGGSASVFRSVALAEAAGASLAHPLTPASLRIQRALKREFDPAGIFNPGRLVAGL